MSKIWSVKYLPSSSRELVGRQREAEKIKKYVLNFKRGGKPLFIQGPHGSGKTSLVQSIARELQLDLIEVNASDTRNKEGLETLLGGAINQASLFFKGKIILVDEVEGLSGIYDRGAPQNILKLAEKSSFPFIIAGLEDKDRKLKSLLKASEIIALEPLGHEEIFSILKNISLKEKVVVEEKAMKYIARVSGGDVRAAINDLQMVSANKEKVSFEDLEVISQRESTTNIKEALNIVFKIKDPKISLGAFDNVSEDVSKVFLWVEENIPREYKSPRDLSRAMDSLALADVFYGRIRRWQYYRFYVYCYVLLSAGISLSKEEKYPGLTRYKESTKPLTIWIMNRANLKKDSIADKVAGKTHVSAKVAKQSVVPYLKTISKNKENSKKMVEYLELDADEVAWLKK